MHRTRKMRKKGWNVTRLICGPAEVFALTSILTPSTLSSRRIRPFPAQLRALLRGAAAASVNQQAPEEGRRVADDRRCPATSAAAPAAAQRGPARRRALVSTPLRARAGACFQNGCRAVHGQLAGAPTASLRLHVPAAKVKRRTRALLFR